MILIINRVINLNNNNNNSKSSKILQHSKKIVVSLENIPLEFNLIN